jgi:hypothetical protein
MWFSGLIHGDGYLDDRHIELYNSSVEILEKAAVFLKTRLDEKRIHVDIYSDSTKEELKNKWARILNLPKENIKIKKNISPWKHRKEKIRLRVGSKKLAQEIKNCSKKPDRDFIKGIFDAEASVDIKGYIEFKQVDKKNGREIVFRMFKLLDKYGIKSTEPKTKRDNINNKTDWYFYVKDLLFFKKLINFTCSDKRRKLEILLNVNKNKKIESFSPMKDQNLWEIMEYTHIPYHKIRALTHYHLTTRQTR